MNNNASQIPPHAAVLDMITGANIAQSIFVAAKLSLADLIGDGAQTAEELARKTDTHAPSLYRLLRALASVGFFFENEKGQFQLADKGKTLRASHPNSVRSAALLFGESWHWGPWGELMYSIRTGKPAFDHVQGANAFEYFQKHGEAARDFNDAMMSFTRMEAPEISAAYDFSKINKLVDIAGGVGGLLVTILKNYPRLQGVLFDLPYLGADAKKHLTEAGLQDRCEFAGGDFFKGVPQGGDAYLMKSIIHDWDDERAIAILKNCHKAMEKNGKLLLAERVIPPGNEPHFGKLLDLEMLVMTQGGKERTEAEYRKLYAAAGFRLTRIYPTRTPMSVIEGIRE